MLSFTACPDKSGKSRLSAAKAGLAGKTLFFLLLFFFPFFQIHAQVTIHVPADYPTIQQGINAAVDGDIVLVDEGTYYENIHFKGKTITVTSLFFIDGDKSHIENTIIDGSQPSNPDSGAVVMIAYGGDSTTTLCGFTITGGTGFKYGAFRWGGGIYIWNSSPTIRYNIIENNSTIGNDLAGGSAINAGIGYGGSLIIEHNIVRNNYSESTGSTTNATGAIDLGYQSVGLTIVRNNSIYDNILTGAYNLYGAGILAGGLNSPSYVCYIENNKIFNNAIHTTSGSNFQNGGGIYTYNLLVYIRNNIIAFNSAQYGGGIYYYNAQNPAPVTPVIENNTIFGNTAQVSGSALNTNRPYDITNCIIWGNSSPQYYGSSATITYSDLEEPYSNGSNNISFDPGFLDTTYFLLSNTSACIDSGNPGPMYYDIEDPNNLGYPLWPAQGTLVNDMGHCGGPYSLWAHLDPPVSVENDEEENLLPTEFALLQNYPNPFNPTTTIKYGLTKRSFVELRVYDILGSEVEVLVNKEQDAGFYKVDFNASRLSSGVYIYQLRAGNFVDTKKMLLLK